MSKTEKLSSKRGKKGKKDVGSPHEKALVFRPQGNPIPLFTDIVMKYADLFTMDAAAPPGVATYLFRANGMYDPDATGTGHQPLGFDQWMGTSVSTGFYNHYLVVSSELKVTLWSQSAGQDGQGVVFVGLADDTTTPITVQAAGEQPTYRRYSLGAMTSGHDVTHIVHRFDACKQFGLTKSSLYARENLIGTYNSDPTEQTFFNIVYSGVNPAVNPIVVCCFVEIIYRAHLTERKEIPTS